MDILIFLLLAAAVIWALSYVAAGALAAVIGVVSVLGLVLWALVRGLWRLCAKLPQNVPLAVAVISTLLVVGWFVSWPDGETTAETSYQYWVTADRLNRRTCPSTDCGIVGQLFFREGTDVLEERDGWARISQYYDALCVDGRSEYVDSGASRCDPDNGIFDGSFAEWVAIDFLSENRPTDPAADATGVEALVSGSDDFQRYRAVFARSAQSLISSERCSEADLRRGWIKSTLNYRNQPIYFLYCGGLTVSNRLYLNAETGEIFR